MVIYSFNCCCDKGQESSTDDRRHIPLCKDGLHTAAKNTSMNPAGAWMRRLFEKERVYRFALYSCFPFPENPARYTGEAWSTRTPLCISANQPRHELPCTAQILPIRENLAYAWAGFNFEFTAQTRTNKWTMQFP